MSIMPDPADERGQSPDRAPGEAQTAALRQLRESVERVTLAKNLLRILDWDEHRSVYLPVFTFLLAEEDRHRAALVELGVFDD